MLIFLAFVIFTSALRPSAVPDILAKLTHPAQRVCIDHAPSSPHRDLLTALVCGKRLPNSDLKSDFVRTALLHLIVASGSHLALIEGIIRTSLRRLWGGRKRLELLVAAILLAYSLFAGLCPPFLRVLLFWGLWQFCDVMKLGWSRLQALTMAGFAALLCCNREMDLLSLALSWIAGLAVHIVNVESHPLNKSIRSMENRFLRSLTFHTLMYLLMIPALMPLATPHPMSILWNFCLGPALAIILFPLAALAFIAPQFLLVFINAVFDRAVEVVHFAARSTPGGFQKALLPIAWVWVYLFTLLAASHWLEAVKAEEAKRGVDK